MAYSASQAQSLELQQARQLEQQQTRRAFEVVEGRGLDASVRKTVSPQFLSRIRMAISIVAVIAVVGCIRISLYAATASMLRTTQQMRSEIKVAQGLTRDLKATTSALSNSARITRIATQNYGMLRAASTEVITLGAGADQTFTASTGNTDKAIEAPTDKGDKAGDKSSVAGAHAKKLTQANKSVPTTSTRANNTLRNTGRK